MGIALQAEALSADSASSMEARLSALRVLKHWASDGHDGCGRASAAEDALHRVLCETSNDCSVSLSEAVEAALWTCWRRSGNSQVDDLMRQGQAWIEKKHYEQALQAFTEVTELYPEFVGGWSERAAVQFLLRRYLACIQDSTRALAIKPRHFGCLATLGLCHRARGDRRASMKWLQECLRVNPGLQSAKQTLEQLEKEGLQKVISGRLWPRVMEVVQSFSDGTMQSARQPDTEGDAVQCDCEWDVFRVEDWGEQSVHNAWRYFFRVRVIRCGGSPTAENSGTIRSLARFYVLRLAGGRIFPLTRLTGPRIFELEPGGSYRFHFTLVCGHELLDAAGGMLLERPDAGKQMSERHYLDLPLGLVTPAAASSSEVERLRLGYEDVGQLDLRDLPMAGMLS